jgi:hypothetical protein
MMFPPERSQPSTLGTLVFILWGLIVWGLQFTAIYVGHTWVCALGIPAASTGVVSVVLTALAIALILPVAIAPARAAGIVALRREDTDSTHLIVIARTVAQLSIVAALWTGGTAAFVQSCALGR